MSEETTEKSGTQTAVAEAPVGENTVDISTINEETVKELRKSGDRDSIRKLIEFAATVSENKKPSPPVVPKKEEATPQPSVEKKKTWQLRHRGNPIEIDDSDGFLGHKDFGGLKKQAARVTLLEKEIAEARTELASKSLKASEAEQLRSELATLKQELEAAKTKIVAPAASPTPPQPEKAVVKAKPIPPQAPETDRDPLDDASVKAWNKYDREVAKYISEISEYLESGQGVPTKIAAELPPEIKAKIERLESEVERTKPLIGDIENAKREQAKNAKIEEFWSRHDAFSKKHPDYATKKPLKEIEAEFIKFQDALAVANGLTVPTTPFNLKTPEWAKYQAESMALADKYFDGDETVKANSEGVVAPEEAEKYLAHINLEKKRSEYIANGILSEKSTLHDAFLKYADDEGILEKTHNETAKENLQKGVENTLTALKQVKQEYATNIPPEISNRETASDHITQEDVNRIMALTPAQLKRADLETLEKRKLILEAINQGIIKTT